VSQAELERRVREGDQEAFARLFEIYRPRLRAYVERQMSGGLKRKVDPDDVLQEVCVSCVKAFASINFAQWSPFDWICQMAHRRIIDAGRRYQTAEKRDARREVALDGGVSDTQGRGLIDLLVASITTPSQAFSRDQREFRLLAALAQLPQEAQQALRMRYVESLPTKQIAERLHKTDGAVRVLLTRSLKRLEKLLGE
jgi:RNA polymerase sigma-70 factor (ECF subfamily)